MEYGIGGSGRGGHPDLVVATPALAGRGGPGGNGNGGGGRPQLFALVGTITAIDIDNNTITVQVVDGNRFVFDVRTGEIVLKSRPARSGEAVPKSRPARIVLWGVAAVFGIELVGWLAGLARRKRAESRVAEP